MDMLLLKDTEILSGKPVSQVLTKGIDTVTACVRGTIGPKGRNVVIDPYIGQPRITNDGFTIARNIEVSNKFENLGCQIIKEVAEKTSERVGDGTTTSIILAQAMLKEGLKYITAGYSPLVISKGMEEAVRIVDELITQKALKLDGFPEIEEIAAVSSGDPMIGKLIRQAMEQVGVNGTIMVEEGKSQVTHLELLEGICFNTGYLSPEMTNTAYNNVITFKDALILITNAKLTYIHEILGALEIAVQSQKPLLIIADDISVELLAILISNKKKGTMNVVVVKTPGYGDRRKDYLQDIAVITGGAVASEETGLALSEVQSEHLGRAKEIKIEKNRTTIIGGFGVKQNIMARCEDVRQAYEKAKPGWTKDKLKERLGWLNGGTAIIKVGAPTILEIKEKQDRISDAVNAVKVSVADGIVPGGGIALLRAASHLDNYEIDDTEFNIGFKIIQKALEAPLRQIAYNSGQNGEIIVARIKKLPEEYGYDAIEDNFVNMRDAGIIDPAQVPLTALSNALSIATLVLNTGGLIVYK